MVYAIFQPEKYVAELWMFKTVQERRAWTFTKQREEYYKITFMNEEAAKTAYNWQDESGMHIAMGKDYVGTHIASVKIL